MPVLCRFLGITIAMYYRDHHPAHFHARYGEHEALVAIASGAVWGSLPPRVLQADWERRQRCEALEPIAPLE